MAGALGQHSGVSWSKSGAAAADPNPTGDPTGDPTADPSPTGDITSDPTGDTTGDTPPRGSFLCISPADPTLSPTHFIRPFPLQLNNNFCPHHLSSLGPQFTILNPKQAGVAHLGLQ